MYISIYEYTQTVDMSLVKAQEDSALLILEEKSTCQWIVPILKT